MLYIGGAFKQKPRPLRTQSRDHVSDGNEVENSGDGRAKHPATTYMYSSGSESDMSDSDAADHSLK